MRERGRPKADNPKSVKISVRLTQEVYDGILEYASQHNLTTSQTLNRSVELLLKTEQGESVDFHS